MFHALVANSDIVIENFSAGVMQKWGCTFDELRAVKPDRLVMGSLSGYGRTGPRARYLAYASSISAFTGLNQVWFPSGTYTDFVTGTHAAFSLLAAHRHAAATGESVYVDACQIETFAAMAASLYLDPLVNDHPTVWEVNSSEGSLFTRVFPAAGEDRWVAIEAVTVDHWNAVCRVVERPELQTTSGADVADNTAALVAALEGWGAVRTPISAAHLLSMEGVPAAPVAVNEEVTHDPQLHERHFPLYFDHPDLGWYPTPGPPYRMSKTPCTFDRFGERVGEHTRDVLRRWAGLDDAAIDALISAGDVFDAGATGAATA